ncbi:MAG: S-layer homology domain-containing protein [Lawsonibacter sp.]
MSIKSRALALSVSICTVLCLTVLPADALGDSGVSVSLGSSHTLACKTDGTLWAWGVNSQGQLGTGKAGEPQSRPVKVLSGVKYASAGNAYSLALKTDGTLWAWGENSCGQLGTGKSGGSATAFDAGVDEAAPVKIMSGVVSMSAGANHAVAVKSDGTLWAWGDNAWGQLGTGKSGGGTAAEGVAFQPGVDEATPVQVLSGVTAAYAGTNRTYAIKADGTLWAWGGALLGDGTSQGRVKPVQILSDVTAVCVGGSHALAVKSDGSLWGWGSNFLGQMGKGTATDSGYLTPVKILDHVTWASAEERYSLAVKADGTLWIWGDMMWGTAQSDNVITESDCIPVQILTGVSLAAAGPTRAAAVKTDGSLWTWGAGHQGELGDGKTAASGGSYYNMTPTKILSGVSTTPGQVVPTDPEDIPSSWAERRVEQAITAGIVPVSLQGKYTRTITRGEFCALGVALYEKVTGSAITGRQTFLDTTDPNVEKLASLGVVSGVGDGRFAPNQKLQREQAALMLVKLAQVMGKPLPAHAATFGDRAKISAWAVDAVGQVQGSGIMSGTGNNLFSPTGSYTREQSIVTMQRLLEWLQG